MEVAAEMYFIGAVLTIFNNYLVYFYAHQTALYVTVLAFSLYGLH